MQTTVPSQGTLFCLSLIGRADIQRERQFPYSLCRSHLTWHLNQTVTNIKDSTFSRDTPLSVSNTSSRHTMGETVSILSLSIPIDMTLASNRDYKRQYLLKRHSTVCLWSIDRRDIFNALHIDSTRCLCNSNPQPSSLFVAPKYGYIYCMSKK